MRTFAVDNDSPCIDCEARKTYKEINCKMFPLNCPYRDEIELNQKIEINKQWIKFYNSRPNE
jgi:hypothetical protein